MHRAVREPFAPIGNSLAEPGCELGPSAVCLGCLPRERLNCPSSRIPCACCGLGASALARSSRSKAAMMIMMTIIMQRGLVVGGGRRQRRAELGSGDSHLVVGTF
jgi:hypothetical protein